MKTGDGSFVIRDFLVISTKINQKMLRGRKWKALSALKTVSPSTGGTERVLRSKREAWSKPSHVQKEKQGTYCLV